MPRVYAPRGAAAPLKYTPAKDRPRRSRTETRVVVKKPTIPRGGYDRNPTGGTAGNGLL